MPKARQHSEASSPERKSNGESPATAAARLAVKARYGEPKTGGWAAVGSKTLRSDVLVPAREVGREGSAVLCCPWWGFQSVLVRPPAVAVITPPVIEE